LIDKEIKMLMISMLVQRTVATDFSQMVHAKPAKDAKPQRVYKKVKVLALQWKGEKQCMIMPYNNLLFHIMFFMPLGIRDW
jgi:hypothetical protein